MKKILIALCATLCATAAGAQTVVEGIVTDSATGNVLPFVNIAVSGTTVGTISDLNGEFRLNVPSGMSGKPLSFSSVGYSPVTKSLPASSDERMTVVLVPVDYKINEVVVTDKSQAGRRVLKDVVENASANYINSDYSFAGTYVAVNSGSVRGKSTYHVVGYDADGYTRSDGNNAFAALNYKFASVVRDFKVNDYESGKNHFDQVCGFDIVRYQFSVLNSYTLTDFDFTIESETSAEYIIKFSCNKPRLVNTGAWVARAYEGVVTVSKTDKAITAAKYTMELSGYSDLALSLKTNGGENSSTTKITADVKYAKYSGKYAVKSIETKTITGGAEVFSDSFTMESVDYKSPRKVSGKVFYSR